MPANNPENFEVHPCKSVGKDAGGVEEMQPCSEGDPDIACWGLYKIVDALLEHVADFSTKAEAERGREKHETKAQVSQGHIGWVGDFEYFTDAGGDLYRAHYTDAFHVVSSRRQGRFEATAAAAPRLLAMLGLVRDDATEARGRGYERKRAARIQRLEDRAESAAKAGQAATAAGSNALAQIPLGQPIIIGSSREKADRNYRHRAVSKIEKGFNLLEYAKELRVRASAAEDNTAISSDDPFAVRKITERISDLEARREWMKLVNKHFSKGTLDQLGFTAEQIAKLSKALAGAASWERRPYPAYELTNLGANVRRLEVRAMSIAAQAHREPVDEEHGEIRIAENPELNRVQIYFPGKPSEGVREFLRKRGFHYSHEERAWQAFRSLDALSEARECVRTFFAADERKVVTAAGVTVTNAVTIDELLEFQTKLMSQAITTSAAREMWERVAKSGPAINSEFAALSQRELAVRVGRGLPPGGENTNYFDVVQFWLCGNIVVYGEGVIDPEFKQELDRWADAWVQKFSAELPVEPAESCETTGRVQI